MNDRITVFKNAYDPNPIETVTWQETLERIKSDKYKASVIKAREIRKTNPDAYKSFKTKFPAVSFCGRLSYRSNDKVLETTGFLIPDLDGLQNIETAFETLKNDPRIWFMFRSPSGDGLKLGVRTEGIKNDNDIKAFFECVNRWFGAEYPGLPLDDSCKDIARLSFVSWDPDLWVHPNPVLFKMDDWPAPPGAEPVKKEYKNFPLPENAERETKYAMKVLDSVCEAIASATKGDKHKTRLKKSKLIGGYLQYLNESDVVARIESALSASGTKDMKVAMKTVQDGLDYGRQHPIAIVFNETAPKSHPADTVADITYDLYSDPDDDFADCNICNQSDQSDTSDQATSVLSNVIKTAQPVIKSPETVINCNQNQPPLSILIKNFIENSTGSFTTRDIDNELCLITRREKMARATYIHRYILKNLISRDARKPNLYHILENKIDWIDYDQKAEESFPINLPFELHRYVLIPPKAIVVIAGSSNAGKTAFILNTLRLNFHHNHDIVYLMSEMGTSEFLTRAKGIAPIHEWKKVKAASKSSQYSNIIKTQNPNGLTAVDFLEEVDGEYFKVASNIREIYDAIDKGVCLIAIQKKTDSAYGRGGQATAEKARLYMSLDYIATQQNAIVCALKIIKVKHFLGKNLQNHEVHFRISRGSQIEPLTDWLNSNHVDRVAYGKAYEAGKTIVDDPATIQDMFFRLTDSTDGRITGKQIETWQNGFPNIDVFSELKSIRDDSYRKPWMAKKSYFHQISGMLGKRNEAGGF